MLKDAVVDFFCIQTVYYLMWDALLGVWTWLCMFQVSLQRDWWYLAGQSLLDYFNLLELFAIIFWLVKGQLVN